jgi:erythromycin esterase
MYTNPTSNKIKDSLVLEFKSKTHLLNTSKDLDALIDRVGDSQFVLLGEASRGTHEYYTWRTAISKRLITEKGFNIIAVEGDWPDCYRLNRYIKGYDESEKKVSEVLQNFKRWPTWLWANWETTALVTWLKENNSKLTADKKTGFYGLDVYSLWESMEAIIEYLEKTDTKTLLQAKKAMECFEKHGKDERLYATERLSVSCRESVVKLLQEIRINAMHYNSDPEASLNMLQNAYVAVEAEKYYRKLLFLDSDAWNLRAKHMMETLNRLIQFHGPQTKIIIWAHNEHIGNAKYTNMPGLGLVNLGQLLKEKYTDKEVVSVGFCSHEGKVLASNDWRATVEEMEVPPAEPDSIENKLHNESEENRLFIFNRLHPIPEEGYGKYIPHRSIGVVYHPKREYTNYTPSLIHRRYDALIYIDKTTALYNLQVEADLHQLPAGFPFEF